jgi:hypothetical protein
MVQAVGLCQALATSEAPRLKVRCPYPLLPFTAQMHIGIIDSEWWLLYKLALLHRTCYRRVVHCLLFNLKVEVHNHS